VAQRRETLRRLALGPGERVLDIGSGPGFLCGEMADIVGPSGAVQGVDISADMVRRAAARNDRDWLSYTRGDARALPCEDGAFDVVVSTQVAEYVPDIAMFCAEVWRVLRPGGRGLILATDWETVAWHSDDPARMRRVLDAFRPHCADPVLPRTLAPPLRQAGLQVTDVAVFMIVNVAWDEQSYSRHAAPFITAYVRSQGSLPEAELQAWEAELEALGRDGRYWFTSCRLIFEIARPG
ncbi:MAG: methyltransferase domain-containing protein, partial [Geminicoccaceae bacterium]